MTNSQELPPGTPPPPPASPAHENSGNSGIAAKLTWGVILIGLGLLFTAYNLDWIDVRLRVLWEYWPLILVAVGLAKMIDPKERESGGWLILFGLYLLVNTLHLWGLHWGNSWSLILIAVGLMIIFQAWHQRRHRSSSS